MSRLTERFTKLYAQGEKALVCYVTAGDPSPEATIAAVNALAKAGVDAVEVGIPFSDPLADGPTVQASSQRSLEGGMTTAKALEILRTIRQNNPDLPLVPMTYFNPIRRYGLERYARDAKEAGVDGHIVTDLTPEEAGEWKQISDANGLDTIFLLAPTSTLERIEVVCKLSSGFVYCVSRTGVTGAREDVPVELKSVVEEIKAHTSLPVCVGFGISRPEHVQRITSFADGVVVGSALVDLMHRAYQEPNFLAQVEDYAATLKAATK